MRRRDFITLISSATAWPAAARAQKADKVYRVGIFATSSRDRIWHLHKALIGSLSELGYVEGRNIVFENRFAEGKIERVPSIAAELVSLKPDGLGEAGICQNGSDGLCAGSNPVAPTTPHRWAGRANRQTMTAPILAQRSGNTRPCLCRSLRSSLTTGSAAAHHGPPRYPAAA